MSEWFIEWRGRWWLIKHQPKTNLMITAEHDPGIAEQKPIFVYRASEWEIVNVPWPWIDTSPQPDEVIAELRRIAAEYMEGGR